MSMDKIWMGENSYLYFHSFLSEIQQFISLWMQTASSMEHSQWLWFCHQQKPLLASRPTECCRYLSSSFVLSTLRITTVIKPVARSYNALIMKHLECCITNAFLFNFDTPTSMWLDSFAIPCLKIYMHFKTIFGGEVHRPY